MNSMIIFAGTTEGRRLVENFSKENIRIYVSVATEYGADVISKSENVTVKTGRMDIDEMKSFIRDIAPAFVIDATHPFASEATKNIKTACSDASVRYIRLLRDTTDYKADCIFVKDSDEAADYLNLECGNVLLTVGSKELFKYTKVSDFKNRLFVRMLPSADMIDAAKNLGFDSKNLICMQGPFSRELNAQMMKDIDAKFVVTKDSGDVGGIKSKIDAARDVGAKLIIITRPFEEDGFSFDEVCSLIENHFGIQKRKYIAIVGTALGNSDLLTYEAKSVCEKADVLIGAKRLIKPFSDSKKELYEAVYADDIVDIIHKTEAHNIAVLMSGDVSFFSGAKRLLTCLSEYDVRLVPGISSVSYFAAKLGVAYDDAAVISEHGRYAGAVSVVRRNKKTFILSGGANDAASIIFRLSEYGLSYVNVFAGENLSYENERIVRGTVSELLTEEFSSLCVLYIENSTPKVRTSGWSDTDFIRDKVPMTKSEVRAVVMSKLGLGAECVCWDVGAGSGSVSLEMADIAYLGKVYAVERNDMACELIEKNKRHLGIENVAVIKGMAPDILSDLPAPSHIFIGGSGGNMGEIIDAALSKNPNVRIVINTVTAESFADAVTFIKSAKVKDMEIVQINVSKGHKVGEYNLLTAQNPVFVISCTGGSENE